MLKDLSSTCPILNIKFLLSQVYPLFKKKTQITYEKLTSLNDDEGETCLLAELLGDGEDLPLYV